MGQRKRLYRSADDRIIGGVLGGLAAYFDLDPSLVRIGYVIVTFLTGLLPGTLLYIAMLLIVPEAPPGVTGGD